MKGFSLFCFCLFAICLLSQEALAGVTQNPVQKPAPSPRVVVQKNSDYAIVWRIRSRVRGAGSVCRNGRCG